MTLKAIIKIKDEVNTHVAGLTGQHYDVIHQALSPYVPGYQHTPIYKLGRWDGRINYFTKNGKTYTYLLDDILPYLVKWKYDIEIEDNRKEIGNTPELIEPDIFSHVIHPVTKEPLILRDYQINLVNALIEAGYGIGKAATGAGKTFMTAALAKAYGDCGYRCIVIVPDATLVRQTKDDFVMCGLDVGEFSGTVKEADKQHVIATWQSLKNHKEIVKQFQMVLVDEAHKAKSKILSEILTDNAANIPFRFGVTGTLPEHEVDRIGVKLALGPVRYTINADELIDNGVLSDLHIDVIELEEDLRPQYLKYTEEIAELKIPATKLTYSQFKAKYFPDFAAEKDFLGTNTKRLEWIAQEIMRCRDEQKGNVMCLVNSIKMARKLATMIPNAVVVNGQDTKKVSERQEIYKRFATEDDLVVIATVHIASTGLNINRIFHLFLVDVGKSFIRTIQSIGRGLRTAKDKNRVNIYDICSDLHYAHQHMNKRIAFYKDAKYPYSHKKINYAAANSSLTAVVK